MREEDKTLLENICFCPKTSEYVFNVIFSAKSRRNIIVLSDNGPYVVILQKRTHLQQVGQDLSETVVASVLDHASYLHLREL